jgi:hypothetical protein
LKAVNATASFVLALVLALTAAVVIAAAVEPPPALMSRADRAAALRSIADDTRLALGRCREVVEDSTRALCRARARADEKVALAVLEARYLGTIAARARIERVRARAAQSMDVARRRLAAA